MGSLIMHIAASKIIADEYNLSDKFLAGSIMPDIYGKCGIDRNITHYINPTVSNLPNYKKFIDEQNENIKDEIQLGYLAHLVEDHIWFSKFINKFAKIAQNNSKKVIYLNDNSIHNDIEFANDIYKDYTCIDHYICEKFGLDIEKIKSEISKYFDKPQSREKLDEHFNLNEYDLNRKNVFLTKKNVDEFIDISSNEAKRIIEKLLTKE